MGTKQQKQELISRVGRLNTADSVRRELARVYRQARDKKLPIEEAKELTAMLSNIADRLSGQRGTIGGQLAENTAA